MTSEDQFLQRPFSSGAQTLRDGFEMLKRFLRHAALAWPASYP